MWGVSFLRNFLVTSPVALKTSKKAAELLSLFKDRGLHIEDEVLALQALKTLGYYRLTGYAYPLRQTEPVMSGLFKEGAALSLVVELAKFDKQLRLLALNGLETIELAVRVAIANRLGACDPEAHMKVCWLASCNPKPHKTYI
jgi:abortive infection bacteriophage resistance protein